MCEQQVGFLEEQMMPALIKDDESENQDPVSQLLTSVNLELIIICQLLIV